MEIRGDISLYVLSRVFSDKIRSYLWEGEDPRSYINATYAVAKRKPEGIRLAGIRTLTSAIPLQRSNQLS